ncbi:unnamed protein product [Camellia sinensis]
MERRWSRGRDDGWIPVVSQWKGGGAQSKEAQHGLITVFVDNIPSTMDAKALYKLFIKFGIVKDTYIPFKRRKVTNSRFGFVRYNCSIAASVAIQKGNGLLVDDSMLEVKLAAYDRNSRSEQSKKKPQPPRRFSDTINFKGKDALVGHRSFAEVLKGDTSAAEVLEEKGMEQIEVRKGGDYHLQQERCVWLRCYDPTETCFSDEGRILPAAAAWVKIDGDEVAERRAVIGADLACTNEVVQRKVLPASHTAEEVGTVVEETPCKDGSSRDKAACVEGFSMEGSELNSKSNDGKIR